jgi:uncharacterized protein
MITMNYQSIIDKYYPENDDLKKLLLKHSRQVTDRCLMLCDRHPELRLDRQFLEEAAMLHDIGIRWCDAPSICCHGTEPYLRHGIIGAELLRREGFPRHASVCERHTGTGLTAQQIATQQLPLPVGDYVPESIEEQLVCYADKFFSKSHPDRVLTVAQAAQSLERFGHDGVVKFLDWAAKFE